jgi:hypothetical protein
MALSFASSLLDQASIDLDINEIVLACNTDLGCAPQIPSSTVSSRLPTLISKRENQLVDTPINDPTDFDEGILETV